MAFPNTRHTLIHRLASGGSEVDWREFMDDYWGPVCRFAMRRGGAPLHDAEEIASESFEVLVRKGLLARWADEPRAKLRTLLCGVVCRVQANHTRASSRRAALAERVYEELAGGDLPAGQEDDVFYTAWVEDLLQRSLGALVLDYHRQGKGDYVRVLYGRVCEGLSIAELADVLEVSNSAVDNYYRHAKKRLTESLRDAVRSHVVRYSPDAEAAGEFEAEWGRLAEHLAAHGGLEEAVRSAEALVAAGDQSEARRRAVRKTLTAIGLDPAAGGQP